MRPRTRTGKKDIHGNNIRNGDTVRITMELRNSKPIVQESIVKYCEKHCGFVVMWGNDWTWLGGFVEQVKFEILGGDNSAR